VGLQASWKAAPFNVSWASPDRRELAFLASNLTVAILAQGTSWAVAVTQAFLLPGSILLPRNGVQFHDFTLENSVSQTQVREVLTRQICVFDWCRRHQSKKNTFFFTQNCCFLHFPLYNYHLVFLTFPPFFEKISGPNCLF
jgi:hypothetical protein